MLHLVDVIEESVTIGNTTQDYSKFNYSDGQLIWGNIPPWEMAVKIVAWLPLVIVGLLGNLTIIVVMCCVRSIRTCTNMFIFNMAIADLMTVVLSSWTILVHDFFQNYLLGPFICRSEGFVQVTCFLASVFSLVTISCDRLLAVTFPLAPRLNKNKSLYVIVFIWYASMACGLPTIFYRSWHRREWRDYTEIWCTEDKRLKYYWFTMLVLLCYLPLTIVTIAYSIIIYQVNKYEHRLFLGEQPTKRKYRKKVLLMLFIYVLNFLWCWVLFQLVVLYRYFKPGTDELPKWHKHVFFVAHLLTYMNSAINPIVYCKNNENFRKAVRVTFPRLYHHNRVVPSTPMVRNIEMQPENNNRKDQEG